MNQLEFQRNHLQMDYYSESYQDFERDFYRYSNMNIPLTFLTDDILKTMATSRKNYFFHLYNNFFFKHKLPPFMPYRCFSSIYPLFCSPIQSASWDGAFHPASPEYPSCFPAAAAPQSDLL